MQVMHDEYLVDHCWIVICDKGKGKGLDTCYINL